MHAGDGVSQGGEETSLKPVETVMLTALICSAAVLLQSVSLRFGEAMKRFVHLSKRAIDVGRVGLTFCL